MLRRFSYFFRFVAAALHAGRILGELENIRPRKLIPLSIELCSAPIAVMTEMTEKTPMVMPIMVRPERSLFAPNEVRAIVMISRNMIAIRNAKTNACEVTSNDAEHAGTIVIEHSALAHSSSCSYSYRSAVTGSSREADQAGAKPEIKPVRTETIMLTRTRPSENWIGNDGKALPIPKHKQIGEGQADQAAEQAKRGRFDQELQQNRAPARAERFARPDLLRPLLHAHERDVHDPDRADEERETGDEKSGDRDRVLDRIERALEGLLLVDARNRLSSPAATPRTRRMRPVSSSFASASFVLSFTFTRMSDSLLALKYFLNARQRHRPRSSPS